MHWRLHILRGNLHAGLSLPGRTIWRLMIEALVGSLHFVLRDFLRAGNRAA